MTQCRFAIGQLARKTGCKVQTIRYYEQINLLPAPERSAGNQRLYKQTWLVDSFSNEGGGRVKVSFSGINFNLPCGSEGITLTNQPQPSGG